MTKLPYLRRKKAKGKLYYYFDAGRDGNGRPVLIKLPDIRDPRFGGSYARAKATRTMMEQRSSALTVDELIRAYEKSPEFRVLKPNTQISYSRYLARANGLMRDKHGRSWPAEKVRRQDVLLLRDTLSDTPGAANQMIRSVQALYAWGRYNGKVGILNPAAEVRKFAATPHEPWPEDLIEEALKDAQVGDAVAMLYFTGQRIDDAVAMTWGDVKGDHVLVHVKKKGRDIRVAILPELADRMNAMERPTLTILSNANGQPWTAGGLRQRLQAWAAARGHRVVPHGLRKNAVISLLEAGCTVAEVSGITDQSMQMVEHYAQRVNKLHLGRAAVVKFDAARRARNKAGK